MIKSRHKVVFIGVPILIGVSFVALMALGLCLGLGALLGSQFRDNYYPDLRAAIAADAVGPGRVIPEILPASATQIHERHDIDSNRVWMRVQFNTADIESVLQVVHEVTPPEIAEVEFIDPGSVKWWPRTMNKESFRRLDPESQLRLYSYSRVFAYATDEVTFACYFILNWSTGTAWFCSREIPLPRCLTSGSS